MHRLSPLDTSFLLAESRETPMHVGGLYLFTMPEGVPAMPLMFGLVARKPPISR